MTPIQIKKAFSAIRELEGTAFPYRTARSIAIMKKRLKEELDIVLEAELVIVREHGGELKDGSYKFKGPRAAKDCASELDRFNAEDNDDISLPEVDLSEYVDNLELSPASLESLEGIVIFDRKDGDE